MESWKMWAAVPSSRLWRLKVTAQYGEEGGQGKYDQYLAGKAVDLLGIA